MNARRKGPRNADGEEQNAGMRRKLTLFLSWTSRPQDERDSHLDRELRAIAPEDLRRRISEPHAFAREFVEGSLHVGNLKRKRERAGSGGVAPCARNMVKSRSSRTAVSLAGTSNSSVRPRMRTYPSREAVQLLTRIVRRSNSSVAISRKGRIPSPKFRDSSRGRRGTPSASAQSITSACDGVRVDASLCSGRRP
jgi:hypothetical protein